LGGIITSLSEFWSDELSSDLDAGPSDIADCSSSGSSLDSRLALTRLSRISPKAFLFVEDILGICGTVYENCVEVIFRAASRNFIATLDQIQKR